MINQRTSIGVFKQDLKSVTVDVKISYDLNKTNTMMVNNNDTNISYANEIQLYQCYPEIPVLLSGTPWKELVKL